MYIENETGAVTVDWVVLTAGLVGLGLAVMGVVSQGVQDTSVDIKAELESDTMLTTGFTASNIATIANYNPVGCSEGRDGPKNYLHAMIEMGEWDGSAVFYTPDEWTPDNYDTLYATFDSWYTPGVDDAQLVDDYESYRDHHSHPHSPDSTSLHYAMLECVAKERGLQ